MENNENNDAEDSAVDAGSNQDSLEHEASTSKVQRAQKPCEQSVPKKIKSTNESKPEYPGHNAITRSSAFKQSGCSAHAGTGIKTIIKTDYPENIFCGQRPLFPDNLAEKDIKKDTKNSQEDNQNSRFSGEIKFEDRPTQERPSVITRAAPVRNTRQTSPISNPSNTGFQQRFLKWEAQMLKLHGGLLRQTGNYIFILQ